MIVQIRDRDYLHTQENINPNVTDQMYQYAGDTFSIDEVAINPNQIYSYKGFHWLGKWLTDPYGENQPKEFNLSKTNIDTYLGYIDVNAMPEKLQKIRFVSREYPSEPYTQDLGSFAIVFEKPEIGSRTTDPAMYIKFEGATEYNVTKYLVANTIGRTIYKSGETRQYEDLVVQVFEVLGEATKKYLDEIRNDNIVLNKQGFRQFGMIHYQANFEYIDFSYIPYFFAMALTHYTDYLNIEPIHKLDELADKSLIYKVNDGNMFYGLTQKHYDTYFYNYEIKECPVFGIKYIGKDPLKVYLRETYTDRAEVVLVPNWDYQKETDFLNYLYERLADTDHPWSYISRGYLFRGQVYNQYDYETMLEKFEKYKLYGLSFLDDHFTYDGNKYYFGDDVINDYDYEPYISFFGENDDLHLGVELEIDRGGEDHDNANMVTAPLGRHAYVMHDGSLDNGFEIATMPMTLDYAESIKDRFDDSMGIARLLGYESHNTSSCGLHIHFDKDFFGRDYRTQNTKASYLAIIMERNWEKFVQFSRRNYSRLDNWAKKLDLIQDIYADDTDDDAQDKFSNKYGNGEKYVALNTSHSNTYELRIFRGTLKTDTLFATMQFVDNLVRVAKECPSLSKAQQITFADIIDYKHHKELIEYVNTRGILTREYKQYEGA